MKLVILLSVMKNVMKKASLMLVICVLVIFSGLKSAAQIKYPVSQKTDIANNYFGVTVPDPYRWLEFDNTGESNNWTKEQNAVTGEYLNTIPFRNDVRIKLQSLSNFPHYASPAKQNGIYYFLKSDGTSQPVLYSQKDLKSEPEVFFDPGKSPATSGQVAGEIAFSKKSKYCAYSTSKPGSDWNTVYVIETATKKILSDKVDWLKLSTIAWQGDAGFYYSRFPEPKGNVRLTTQNRFHSLYFHKIGDPQEADRLVYEDQEHPFRYHFATVTEDDRFLVLYTSEGTTASQIMIRNLDKGDNAPFKMVLEGFKYEAEVFDNDKKYLFVKTNVSAPRYRIVAVNIVNPFVNNWETMIPEQKEVIDAIKPAGGSWIVTYLKDATSTLSQFTTGGYKLRDIALPAVSAATIYPGKLNDNEFFYSYSTFSQPDQIYLAGVQDGKPQLFKGATMDYPADDYETKQLFFNSEDGTKVPMFISYKKGMTPNGKTPVLMNGYGGFNQSLKPQFSEFNLFFMQQGGIYAQVNTRGGSEYGEKWHKGGMNKEKQNAFDDFIAAAEYLVDENYTTESKIAIAGSGNGGLMVAACMVQRPELFKVALPDAGILDMLRFEKFTVGYGWVGEYGSSEDREAFDNLYSYSPLHNLKPGVAYPATLITTSAYNDKVVPAHSYKFAATLQEYQKGTNPVLIRIQLAGDEAETPGLKYLNQQAERLSFAMYNLGMELR
ncbi:prolyl oligopeptidase family serine peptidase [soil metagenome]